MDENEPVVSFSNLEVNAIAVGELEVNAITHGVVRATSVSVGWLEEEND